MRVLVFLAAVILSGCAQPASVGEGPQPNDSSVKNCGGLAGLRCGAEEWCAYPADAVCGHADVFGACRKRPEACTLQYDPVCGCDGRTYGNACQAAAGGTDVSHRGPCKSG